MEKIIERCPECGNYTDGVPAYSTERKKRRKRPLLPSPPTSDD